MRRAGGALMHVVIDLEACILAGECVYNHPDRFGWNDDDQPVVLRSTVEGEEEKAAVEQAIAVCPSGAISMAP